MGDSTGKIWLEEIRDEAIKRTTKLNQKRGSRETRGNVGKKSKRNKAHNAPHWSLIFRFDIYNEKFSFL